MKSLKSEGYRKSATRSGGGNTTEGRYARDEEEALTILRLHKSAALATVGRGEVVPFNGTVPRLAWQDRPLPAIMSRP